MGDYYNYTGKFNEIITNTKQIIENQEQTNTNLQHINITTEIIAFTIILDLTIRIVKKVFAVR